MENLPKVIHFGNDGLPLAVDACSMRILICIVFHYTLVSCLQSKHQRQAEFCSGLRTKWECEVSTRPINVSEPSYAKNFFLHLMQFENCGQKPLWDTAILWGVSLRLKKDSSNLLEMSITRFCLKIYLSSTLTFLSYHLIKNFRILENFSLLRSL